MSSKLTYASLPQEIKRIANESLGLGVLKSLFGQNYTYHLMIKVNDGEFIGFVLYHFQNSRDAGGESKVVGIIDCVCVATTYRKEGFGTLLTYGALRKMSAYGADAVEILMKTPGIDNRDGEPGIPLLGSEKLLYCMGFRKVKVIQDHYSKRSIKYGYDCKFCGDRPDSCMGVLYSIEERHKDPVGK